MMQPNIKQIYKQLQAQAVGCAGCGGDFEGVGTFIPHDQASVSAPADKLRSFFYPVCCNCMADPQAIAKIEAMLVKNFHIQH